MSRPLKNTYISSSGVWSLHQGNGPDWKPKANHHLQEVAIE